MDCALRTVGEKIPVGEYITNFVWYLASPWYLDDKSNIILGVSLRMFLDEINI